MSANWIVTGGCGFIGRTLVRRILDSEPGACVRVVDTCETDGLAALPAGSAEVGAAELSGDWMAGVVLVRGDVRDAQLAAAATGGADAVVHLAASPGVQQSIEDPLHDFDVNARGTVTYLDAARRAGAKAFVFASSGAVVGEQEPPLTEELRPAPISPYGAGKRCGELYCETFARAYGLRAIALRFSNVYGPGSIHKGSVVAKFIRCALQDGILTLNGTGEQTRDFVHVQDIAAAVIAAATSQSASGVYHISTGRETTIRELAELVSAAVAAAGHTAPTLASARPLPGDVARNFALPERAARELGWKPRADLQKGIEETVRWFLQDPRPPV